MKFTFTHDLAHDSGALVVGVETGRKLTQTAQIADQDSGGAVSRAVKGSAFKGKAKQTLSILAPLGMDHSRIVLYGTGEEPTETDWQDIGGSVYKAVANSEDASVTIAVDGEGSGAAAANLAYGFLLRSYRFDKYKTKNEDSGADGNKLKKVTVVTADAAVARKAFKAMQAVAEGVFLTRDLVSEPPNELYPETLADRAKDLEDLGIEVDVLGEKEMKKLGMHALLGVGQGSARESRLVVMKWNGGPKKQAPLAFVGKGVTFDTGGISLKPGPGMDEMKWDMGGSGVVVGLMKALAGRKAKVNAVGIVGCVENMPDGNAQRPGDIVKSMSGQTIEILNTDAEGRLVLADALWYCQEEFKPQLMVDLATLTGAIIVGLGHDHAGLFSNDDTLAEQLFEAGQASGDRVWRLPLHENYDKQLKSDVADMKNIGGKAAGSITAAQFLKRFVNDTKWAHLDIAGTTWASKEAPTTPKGGTGFGVRLLDRFVADNYEG